MPLRGHNLIDGSMFASKNSKKKHQNRKNTHKKGMISSKWASSENFVKMGFVKIGIYLSNYKMRFQRANN